MQNDLFESKDFYDCKCLKIDVVQRRRLDFLQIVVDQVIQCCHCLVGLVATVHFLVNHLRVAVVWLAHRNLPLAVQHNEVNGDRIQALLDNVANVDNRLGIANSDCMIFPAQHYHLHHHYKELKFKSKLRLVFSGKMSE